MPYRKEIQNIPRFCIVPFTSLNVDPDGTTKQCCVQNSRDLNVKYTDYNSLYDLFNNRQFKTVRDYMKENRIHPSCANCYKLEDMGVQSERQRRNQDYIDKYHDIGIKNLSLPNSLDLRLSNKCNLKCRMCHESASSQIASEKVLSPDIIEISGTLVRSNISDWADLRLLGGEPSIMPQVYDILQALIDQNKTDVRLMITTNATTTKQDWYDLVSNFQNITWQFSIDSIYKTNDYIRTNSSYQAIKQNIKKYKDLNLDMPHWELSVSQTVQIYNLHDYFKLSEDLGELIDFVNPTVLTYPNYLNIENLPNEIKKKYTGDHNYNDVNKILETNVDDGDAFAIMWQFVNYTNRLDMIRGTKFSDINPELWQDILDFINKNYTRYSPSIKEKVR